MKILVFGANGQLGSIFCEKYKNFSIPITSKEVDITRQDDVEYCILDSDPDLILNCAAFTNVNLCEGDGLKTAIDVNYIGVSDLALLSKRFKKKLIHISTDYVYNQETPIYPIDKVQPINVYGKTKSLGDTSVINQNKNNLVIRTGSLFSDRGKNFIVTLINLYKEGKKEFDIVDDILSRPTSSFDLAKIIFENKDIKGITHFSGDTLISWYDYAKLIFEFDGTVKINRVKSKSSAVKRPVISNLISSPQFGESDFKSELNKTLKLLEVI